MNSFVQTVKRDLAEFRDVADKGFSNVDQALIVVHGIREEVKTALAARQIDIERKISHDLRMEMAEATEKTRLDFKVSIAALRDELVSLNSTSQMGISRLDNANKNTALLCDELKDKPGREYWSNDKDVNNSETVPMVDLVRMIRDDEEEERGAHEKLLARIDELCNHLEVLEANIRYVTYEM